MAIYGFSAQVIGRGAGRSAVAAAAYRAGTALTDERTGDTHDYSRRRGCLHSEIIAPDNTPAWMLDRAQLWNGVEAAEKRKDAQLAREIVLSLPHELDDDQRRELVRGFVRETFVDKGMIADIAIHAPDARGDARNHHAHVMLTMRELTGQGFGPKARDWNRTELLESWRADWAMAANHALERAGHSARIDHRSLADQGLDREPEPKQGPVATDMERQGRPSHAGADRRAVQERNAERTSLRAEATVIDIDLKRAERAEADQARRDAWFKAQAPLDRAETARRETTRAASGQRDSTAGTFNRAAEARAEPAARTTDRSGDAGSGRTGGTAGQHIARQPEARDPDGPCAAQRPGVAPGQAAGTLDIAERARRMAEARAALESQLAAQHSAETDALGQRHSAETGSLARLQQARRAAEMAADASKAAGLWGRVKTLWRVAQDSFTGWFKTGDRSPEGLKGAVQDARNSRDSAERQAQAQRHDRERKALARDQASRAMVARARHGAEAEPRIALEIARERAAAIRAEQAARQAAGVPRAETLLPRPAQPGHARPVSERPAPERPGSERPAAERAGQGQTRPDGTRLRSTAQPAEPDKARPGHSAQRPATERAHTPPAPGSTADPRQNEANSAANRTAGTRATEPVRYDPSPEARREAAQRAAQRLLDLAREQGDRSRDDELERHHRLKGPGRR